MGIELLSSGNWKGPDWLQCREEAGGGKGRAHGRALGLPFNLGEAGIPEMIMDRLLHLDLHVILKDQVSC